MRYHGMHVSPLEDPYPAFLDMEADVVMVNPLTGGTVAIASRSKKRIRDIRANIELRYVRASANA